MGGPWVNRLKVDVRYRRAGVKADHCRSCNHYVERFRVSGPRPHEAGFHPRCRVLGLKAQRRYKVYPDYVCDRFDGTINQLLDMGEAWYRENFGEEKLREALKARDEKSAFIDELKKEGKV
jgi:hypothetical protein